MKRQTILACGLLLLGMNYALCAMAGTAGAGTGKSLMPGAQLRLAQAKTTPQAQPKAKPAPKKEAEPDNKAHLIEKFDDWTVFVHDGGADGKVCFASSTPKDASPKGAKRTPVYFYVTTWQKDGVRNEVSVKLGYEIKPDSTPTVTIGNSTFDLFPRDDKAFIKNPPEERKLVQAMLAGSTMVVKAASSRGTETTDQYSLSGITAATKKVEEVCP